MPTQGDQDTYITLILSKEEPIKAHRMIEAYQYFDGVIRGLDLDGKPIEANRMFDVITQNLQVVSIGLSETDDPYLIFESLNYKGAMLTQADLVRNYVLMRFRHSLEPGGEQERIHSTIWKPLEDTLVEALPEYLRHYLMKEGMDIRQGGIYAAVKNRLKNLNDTDIQTELTSLKRHGGYYRAFLMPANESSPRVRRRLAAIFSIEVTTCYPLLLRLFENKSNGVMTEDELELCLHYIESFVVRRNVCDVPTNQLNKLFLQLAKTFPKTGFAAWLRASLSSGSGGGRWPNDTEFEEAIKSQPQYGRKTLRHILVRLEEAFGSKELADLSKVTIEHIMPQDLSEAWKSAIGSDHIAVHAKYLHTLGNLTLTAYNTELGNLSFEEKKAKLKDSHIDLNKWICDQSKWDQSAILGRATVLAATAKSIFGGPIA